MKNIKKIWFLGVISVITCGLLLALVSSTSLVHAAQLNIVVTNTNDAGAGSLRDAITQANAASTTSAAPHNITFNIPVAGVQTISLTSALPVIAQPTVINGLSQPGASCGVLVPQNPDGTIASPNTPHTLLITVTTRGIAAGADVLSLASTAAGSQIKGLVVNGALSTSKYNIRNNAPDAQITCNYIGPEADGLTTVPAGGLGGIYVGNSAATTHIENNLISGNNEKGIDIWGGTGGHTVYKNLIGTDSTGMNALPNLKTASTVSGAGVNLRGAANVDIYKNIISGNPVTQVTAASSLGGTNSGLSNGLKLRGNFIGPNITGQAAISGNTWFGRVGGNNIVIGGTTPDDRNVISGNPTMGLWVENSTNAKIVGNYVGVKADGIGALPNAGGISTAYSGTNIQIGGSLPGEGNIVAGNTGVGINVAGTINGSSIKGNYVGLGSDGTTLVPNANSGISVAATAANTQIGGVSANERNIVVANGASMGIDIYSTNAVLGQTTVVEGNYIGLKADGITKGPNTGGVFIRAGAKNVRVGGSAPGQRNYIASNTTSNVQIMSNTADSNITILGNYIGLAIDGTKPVGANTTQGIYLAVMDGVRVGGSAAGEGNYISGNSAGINANVTASHGKNVQIYGNTIGLNESGTVVANGRGVYMYGLTTPGGSIEIGGSTAGQGNIIAGNTNEGIYISDQTVATNAPKILGNRIGVDSSGAIKPNGKGVRIANSYGVQVGGVAAGEANIIRGNTGTGVNVEGTIGTGNVVRGNAIYGNGSVGIDLPGILNAPDVWDLSDADTGPNGKQNFARRTAFTKCDASTEQRIVLRSLPNATYTVDFYANPSGRDATGYGEGEVYDSSTTVTTDGNGYAAVPIPALINLSMTATDANGSTSEFSNERAAVVSGCDVTSKTTTDSTPSLSGAVSLSGFTAGISPTTAKITVDGQDATASISGSTWTVADNVFSTIPDGTYDVAMTITDPETTITTTYTEANALTIDATAPTVSIVRKSGQAEYTKTNTAHFTVTLSEPIQTVTLTAGDINLGTTTGTVSSLVQIDATHYEIEVSGMTSGDTVTATIAANTFTDLIGNANTASTGSPNNWVMYDATTPQTFAINVDVMTSGFTMDAPQITWSTTDGESGIDHYEISYDGGSFTTATSPQTPTLTPALSHTVTVRAYDRAGNMTEKTVVYPPIENINAPTTLSNVAINDTTVEVTGPTGMIITNIAISGAGSSGFSCGALPATIPISCTGGTITATGTLTVAATSNAGVTTSNTQAYVIDTVIPTVTIEQAAGQPDPTNQSTAHFHVVFSETMQVSTFTAGDITLSGTASGNVSSLSKIDDQTWDITVSNLANGETVVATIPSGVAKDLAGNLNTASTSTDNSVTVDLSKPTVTINQASAQTDPTNVDSATFDVVFSEPVTGLGASSFALSGTSGSVTTLTQVNTTTWRVIVTGMTSGDTASVALSAGVVTDVAGNSNTASTSTDNSVTYDSTPPAVTVNVAPTNSTSPELIGTINDPTAVIQVTVNGNVYTAVNNGDGTWTLPSGTIAPALAEGIYEISVSATDTAGNSGTDTTTNELTVDLTAPTGTVDAIPDGYNNSPGLGGTVNDPTAIVTVLINGVTYTATNNSDGTWTLPPGTVTGLVAGEYTATVTFSDEAGNTSTTSTSITILRPDADLPTVTATTWVGGQPIIIGTYDSANSQSLTIAVNGVSYVLGSSSQLSVSGNTWRLDLSALSPKLEVGSYSVTVSITTRDGSVLGDTTTSELNIIEDTLINIITHPLANTGVAALIPAAFSFLLICLGLSVVAQPRKHKMPS